MTLDVSSSQLAATERAEHQWESSSTGEERRSTGKESSSTGEESRRAWDGEHKHLIELTGLTDLPQGHLQGTSLSN